MRRQTDIVLFGLVILRVVLMTNICFAKAAYLRTGIRTERDENSLESNTDSNCSDRGLVGYPRGCPFFPYHF